MDELDRKILSRLQRDSRIPIAELAEEVGASRTVCWRRIKALEETGVIRGQVALLDRGKLNLPVTVFVAIKTSRHEADWLQKFAAVVEQFPEITEFYRMSGDVDYLLKVVVPDVAAYDRFYQRLIRRIDLSDVSSNFAMEEIKFTTALPLQNM
ncbi:MAG: transcriptional regulator [Sneathiella sp.]|jgi:Lrp/AsnC family transcriptional regulator|uniref:Lrp/AsnC family transcriptional regulator n=1 Tax=Sneathiella sp. TaxID=1964365 RepID=UPI000C4985F3|nr:Lrp/AsnC family transcriptional regulator [Sneathiella sp.]MAL80151.1 transcriptional regulator [Sneathiella sp.]|tara:strand:+ start:9074 stop:9532 length:459 start_codon:yes stop_codon:yes gene_type:complete